ncbi:MAG: FHA domain-containing protein [SAR324 cluster bacterium]|uniref:FHA domain-containing protein n=1 Tax=SAR324 cluster bacterium TaxID=2024889 RepID=A0A7X9IJK2_9DELT|nr:FHA domain-containing protein [SAR324 cluster bacterium]
MFALEIDFNDGVSQPETILVRRPQVVIGASDFAHVVIEDMKEHNIELRVIRERGRSFRCKFLGSSRVIESLGLSDSLQHNSTSLRIADLELFIQALDIDLLLRDSEPPDRAGVRILQSASASTGPVFPAVMVLGQNPMMISFSQKQEILIGRSNQCVVRLDSPEISSQHAKMGFEKGEFWIEDLGSTNGTFLNGQQIGTKTYINAGVPLVLGREISIVAVDSDEMVESVMNISTGKTGTALPPPRRAYPALICVSERARPSRVVIPQNSTIKIGRDPASDMSLGVPHVSRTHCLISRSHDNEIIVKDQSTNGTYYEEGVLERGDSLSIHSEPKVLDFGAGVTVAICFNEEQERIFLESNGASLIFADRRTQKASRSSRGTKSIQPGQMRSLVGIEPKGSSNDLSADYNIGPIKKSLISLRDLDDKARRSFYVVIGFVLMFLCLLLLLLKPVFFGG